MFHLFQFFIGIHCIIRLSNSLDPDQARHFVGPDLGPSCLHRLSAEDTSRQRVNPIIFPFQKILSVLLSKTKEVQNLLPCFQEYLEYDDVRYFTLKCIMTSCRSRQNQVGVLKN